MYLFELSTPFHNALAGFKIQVEIMETSKKKKEKALQLLEILTLLDEQNYMKIRGEKHIENRIVSLDEPEARPITKGKTHPKCEFGTTFQATFNRQGFMITVENFIGSPNDKTLYPDTLELFKKRMKTWPKTVVTDLGYRSNANFKISKDKVKNVFLGRSDDVDEKERDFCQKARSATEGFIAVVKNWRGFKRSLYKGFSGDRIWSLLCQCAIISKSFSSFTVKKSWKKKHL